MEKESQKKSTPLTKESIEEIVNKFRKQGFNVKISNEPFSMVFFFPGKPKELEENDDKEDKAE